MQRLIEESKRKGILYTNPSWNYNGSSINARDIAQLGGYDKMDIFKGEVDPKTIVKGELADQYLLCCIAIIAEKPERIKKMFLSKKKNEQGVYGVSVFKNGVKRNFIMDEKIKTNTEGKLCYARSNEGELWVMLLEKAYA